MRKWAGTLPPDRYVAMTAGSRYRPSGKARWPALAGVAAVGGLFVLMAAQVGRMVAPAERPMARMVVEMIPVAPPPPPPPPPSVRPEPLPRSAPLVVPPPLVRSQNTAPTLVAETRTPSQPSSSAVTAERAPEPSSSATQAPPSPTAPPAPIIPPDAYAAGLDNPPPRYPIESRRLREQGTVILLVEVGEAGRVESLRVHQSSGHARLDRAAAEAVRSWRFRPARQAGRPIAASGIVEIPFVLVRDQAPTS